MKITVTRLSQVYTGNVNHLERWMHRKRKKIPSPVYVRYVLFNLPGLIGFTLIMILLSDWLAMPKWIFWTLIAGWIAKEAVVFPFVWRAYHRDSSKATATLVGERGITKKRMDPSGTIQVRGELWNARRIGAGPPIEAGRPVRIHKMEGLTLFVEPDDIQEG